MRKTTKEYKEKLHDVFKFIGKNSYLFELIYDMKEDERIMGHGYNGGWARHNFSHFNVEYDENEKDEPIEWHIVLYGYCGDDQPLTYYLTIDEFFELKETIDEQIVFEKLRKD